MYRSNIEDYVPQPSPAHSDYVIAAHYYAAWKKGAAGIRGGFEDLHDYPDRTPLMGFSAGGRDYRRIMSETTTAVDDRPSSYGYYGDLFSRRYSPDNKTLD